MTLRRLAPTRHFLRDLAGSAALFVVLGTQAVAQTRAYDIPAQPLTAALTRFAQESGLGLALPAGLTAGLEAPAVSGALSPEAALQQLLSQSGLSGRIDGGNIRIARPSLVTEAVGDDVVVLRTVMLDGGYEEARGDFPGYLAGRTATATKSSTPLHEVPQSISVIGRAEIESRSSARLSEVLRYAPGVTVEADGADSRYDSISVRGFNTDNATWLDGMPYQAGASLGSGNNWTIPQIDPFTLERVEILKGPSSSLYGQLPPGGMINQLSKRPTGEAGTLVEATLDGFGKPGMALDTNGLTAGGLEYRLIAKSSETGARIDEGARKRLLFAPSLAMDLGEGRLVLHGQYQRDRGGIEYSWLPAEGTLTPGRFGEIGRDFFTGDPDFNAYDRDQKLLSYEYETPLGDSVTLRHALRWSSVKTDIRMLQSDLWFYDAGDWDGRTMPRYALHAWGETDSLVTDTSLNWDLTAGDLRHRVVLGLDYARSDFNATRMSGTAPDLDLYDPVYGAGGIGSFELLSKVDSRLEQTGIYLQDQIEIGNWRLLGGLRHDRTESRATINFRGTPELVAQKDKATSGRIGALYLFDNGFAPYVSYGTSFQPQVGITADGTPFKPTRGQQAELGLRYAPSDDLLWTAAIFDIRQTNRLTDDPVNGWPEQVQTGEIRARGLETELKADLANGWSVTAGYAYTDTKVTQSEIPEELGQAELYAPRHQASLWVDYTLAEAGPLEGWTFGAGVRRTGSSRGGDIETPGGYAGIRVPGYTLLDARVSMPLSLAGNGAELNLSINNLTDARYVSGCGSIWTCGYGYGRTASLTLTSRF